MYLLITYLSLRAERLRGLGALEHGRPLRRDEDDLLRTLGASGHPLAELHDELVVAGEQVPATPREAQGVGCQRHAVV